MMPRGRGQAAQSAQVTTAGMVAGQVAYGAIPGAIDAGVLGGVVALTMIWNGSRAESLRLTWSLGELLVAFFAAGSSRPGRFRDVALGVEAGAISTILAPLVMRGGG